MSNETTEYLTTDEVCGKLAAAGVDEATIGKVFAARLEPQHLDDPARKFSIGVPGPDGQAYLVIFRFGRPVGAEEDHFKPQWLSVEGPFPVATDEDKAAIAERAKELTASD